jgi:hypothetical protein
VPDRVNTPAPDPIFVIGFAPLIMELMVIPPVPLMFILPVGFANAKPIVWEPPPWMFCIVSSWFDALLSMVLAVPPTVAPFKVKVPAVNVLEFPIVMGLAVRDEVTSIAPIEREDVFILIPYELLDPALLN